MVIYSVFVVNKAGSLIYHNDHSSSRPEVEKTFGYPLELTLKLQDERLLVIFGQRDGIRVGHTLLAINGEDVSGTKLGTDKNERNVMDVLNDPSNYPISIKFGRPKLSSNERIMLASMFHSLFAIGSQLSPEPHSSGIEVLETDAFKLHCFQTQTGIKFIVLTDPRQGGVEAILHRLHELYADYALKNSFYALDMPIRCELFDTSLQAVLEQAEKSGVYSGV
ncbi:PREDICTED: trafficking protein particle complex subunit 4-like [Branchiostoma belcheri]|uniref:Trafficking protein particle complex subunit n=1 Tax=Branchiostoma belcheri TaxID=7741 RepID=A0A6P4ZZG0_BRABE|nr:PREDICTED: trafficking protein particle complex subunit 4-like [Branchiostoma belcheri]KAI8486941.1 Trafficking protein particle complex subunit 4 [Branchiostoma belcheri]